MSHDPNKNGHQYSRERVLTEDLAGVLQIWRDRYEAERPQSAMVFRSKANTSSPPAGFDGREFFGAMKYMSFHSGVSERRISSILAKETKTTSFWLADQILTPLGLQNALGDGRIRSADFRQYGPKKKQKRAAPSEKPYMSELKQPKYMSNERWFEFLDQIGCRR